MCYAEYPYKDVSTRRQELRLSNYTTREIEFASALHIIIINYNTKNIGNDTHQFLNFMSVHEDMRKICTRQWFAVMVEFVEDNAEWFDDNFDLVSNDITRMMKDTRKGLCLYITFKLLKIFHG